MVESHESHDRSSRALRGRRVLFLGLLFCASASAAARAQGANGGAITFSGGVDAPSVYVFRGIVREEDPKTTVSPYGRLAVILRGTRAGDSQDITPGGVTAHVGVWNSLQTGSSGSSGYTEHSHYEEDFNAGLTIGLARRLTVDASYTAYTSPNFQFNTVKEVSVRVAHTGWVRPYATVASELGDTGLDGGVHTGTYLEVGAGPRFDFLGETKVTLPVRVGASLEDYYELNGKDRRFGFASVGGLLTVPLGVVPSRLGAWNLHGGVDVYQLGEFAKNANKGTATKVVASFGVGLTY